MGVKVNVANYGATPEVGSVPRVSRRSVKKQIIIGVATLAVCACVAVAATYSSMTHEETFLVTTGSGEENQAEYSAGTAIKQSGKAGAKNEAVAAKYKALFDQAKKEQSIEYQREKAFRTGLDTNSASGSASASSDASASASSDASSSDSGSSQSS